MKYIIYTTVLETPHVVVAAAIAYKVANPALAIPLALGSHFVLEKVPHWNPHLNTEKKTFGKVTSQSTNIVIFDAVTSLLLGSYISTLVLPDATHALTIFLSCFVSVLPDVVEGPYFFLDMKNKAIEKWVAFQKSLQTDISILPGLTTQFLTTIAALWWIFS